MSEIDFYRRNVDTSLTSWVKDTTVRRFSVKSVDNNGLILVIGGVRDDNIVPLFQIWVALNETRESLYFVLPGDESGPIWAKVCQIRFAAGSK